MKYLPLQQSISITEPIDVQMDQLGNNITAMYQLFGITLTAFSSYF